MAVPFGAPLSRTGPTSPPSQATRCPTSASPVRVMIEHRATDPIEARASPRKPRLAMCMRSSGSRSLLVAWAAKASSRSSAPMPIPSSVTRIRRAPPSSRSTWIRVAPASNAFSTSSFTTEAGRSTTSPAAIWSRTTGEEVMRGALELVLMAPS